MTGKPRDDDGQDPEFDRRVRDALESPPAAVSRVITAALRTGSEPSRTGFRRFRTVVAAAAGVVLVGAAIAGVMWPRTPSTPAASAGLMTNEGDVIVIRMSDRPITLIGPGAAKSVAAPGTMSIVLLGEAQ